MAKKPKSAEIHGDAQYEQIKERARERSAEIAKKGRDIGGISPVADKKRKRRAAKSFQFFCETYFPESFSLAWSDDHIKAIKKIEDAVLRGGLFALAMPRGSGKTTLAETACIWAVLIGAHEFVVLIGADAGHAQIMLESIKTEFETNDLLLADYPEAVYPIRALERIHNRAKGQLCDGVNTRISWTAKEVVLPTIKGSASSGAVIRVAGIDARIRGMKHKKPDGTPIRPTFVVPDDPQTDESARSKDQTTKRLETLNGAVLGLAGPGKSIAGVLPCTVIRHGDLADQLLDRKKSPKWKGDLMKMMYAMPSDMKLWEKYAEIQQESFRADGDGHEATEFYAANREAMDQGAQPAWKERHTDTELSAVQNAMNLFYQDEAAFMAEYQNDPIIADEHNTGLQTAEQIAAKVNGHDRGVVPIAAQKLTGFIDVHGNVLYWAVCAWEPNFTGYVIDYGTWPDQKTARFLQRDIQYTLQAATNTQSVEAAVFAGVAKLTDILCSREFTRDDGAKMRLNRDMVDASWGQTTDVVYQACRQSPHSAILYPSHGRFVGASSRPFSEYKKKPGELIGHHWRIPRLNGARAVRHALYDTNYWKSFVHNRFATQFGDGGCLSLFGSKPGTHALFADHQLGEFPVRTSANGRTVDEWKWHATRPDNHWFDCLVGCAVGAQIEGIALDSMPTRAAPRKRSSKSFAQQQREKREASRK